MDKLDELFNGQYHISIINKIELLGYPDLDKNEEDKFNLLIDHAVIHQIDNTIIEKTIVIRRKHKIKLPDAIIAATCIVNGLQILTLNTKDFENIDGLTIMHLEFI